MIFFNMKISRGSKLSLLFAPGFFLLIFVLFIIIYREVRWNFGAVLPPEIKLNLAEPELEFFR